MPSLLTLSDVDGTGHHAAVAARVGPGKTVAVVGDGAVGLLRGHRRKRLGAEQIIIMGRHATGSRGEEFGATDVVSERGAEAVEQVKKLTDGYGVHAVLECVGLDQSMETAIGVARPGGAVGRVGVPQGETMAASQTAFYENVTVSGGPGAGSRPTSRNAPDIPRRRIEPGRVFDRIAGSTTSRTDTAMDEGKHQRSWSSIEWAVRPHAIPRQHCAESCWYRPLTERKIRTPRC